LSRNVYSWITGDPEVGLLGVKLTDNGLLVEVNPAGCLEVGFEEVGRPIPGITFRNAIYRF
jgi:hypothetical protein